MHRLSIRSAVMVLIFASALIPAFANGAKLETVRLQAGGPAPLPGMKTLEPTFEKELGVTVNLDVYKVDSAVPAVIDGTIDGVFGPNIPTFLKIAKEKGHPEIKESDLQAYHVTEVKIQVAVSPQNPVQSMTSEQITDILTGRVKNWKSIAGWDRPIKVVIPKSYVTTMKALFRHYLHADWSSIPEENIKKGWKYSQRIVLDKNGLFRALQADPGSIGFLPVPEKGTDFTPKYFNSHAGFPVNIIMMKKARAPAQRLFDFLAHKKVFLNGPEVKYQ